MFVLPTSIVRSMAAGAYAGSRAFSLFDVHGADHVALGDRAPVTLGVADPGVFAVEVRGAPQGNENLARTRVAPGQGDADVERRKGDRRGLAAKQAAGAAVPVAAGIAQLRDESGHHAVNDDAVRSEAKRV